MALIQITIVGQSATLISYLVEEKNARRPGSPVSLNHFSDHYSRVLPLLDGDNHFQLAILFHDVNALDIYFFKLLLLILKRKGRGKKHDAGESGNDGVHLQKLNFFSSFDFMSVPLGETFKQANGPFADEG